MQSTDRSKPWQYVNEASREEKALSVGPTSFPTVRLFLNKSAQNRGEPDVLEDATVIKLG